MQPGRKKALLTTVVFLVLLPAAVAQKPPATPGLSATFAPPVTFATHAELAGYGFQWGPSDGQFGAIPQGNGTYTFYGTAGSSPKCAAPLHRRGPREIQRRGRGPPYPATLPRWPPYSTSTTEARPIPGRNLPPVGPPTLSGISGKFAPLFTDQGGGDNVIYDSASKLYLTVIQSFNEGLWIRASSDLLHWSEPIGFYSEDGRDLWYPNLVGETGDPTIAGSAPRLYFSSFPTGAFPDYSTQVFESVALTLSPKAPPPFLKPETPANGATYDPGGLVPGSWAQVTGFNLSSVTSKWDATDFTGLGNNLPTNLSGTQLTVNGIPAAVYYIQPDQVNFQVPAGVSGNVSIQVTTNGVASNMATGSVVANSPGIFPIVQQGNAYPAAVFLDGKLAGDPAIEPYFRKAHPGDILQLYATGLVASQAGVVPNPQTIGGVTVTIGSVVVTPSSATLVGVGLFQINFTVPQQFATLAEGVYPISIQVNGASSPART